MVFFGFTQCPDVCPTALTRALEIRELLGADGARLAVAFITIDPERDTAQVLKAYVGAFDPGFVALRGDEAGVEGADRKSTRLNSSHANISYAVFCLKKKKVE